MDLSLFNKPLTDQQIMDLISQGDLAYKTEPIGKLEAVQILVNKVPVFSILLPPDENNLRILLLKFVKHLEKARLLKYHGLTHELRRELTNPTRTLEYWLGYVLFRVDWEQE